MASLARDIRTIPNLITLSRIVLLVVAASMYVVAGWRVSALVLATVAGVTDILDGIVARRTGQVTRLGEILDQFSDLFFESTVLIIATAVEHVLPPMFLVLYLLREFWVTSIRRFMAEHRINIKSSALGKAKTNLIMWSFIPTFLSAFGTFPSWEPYLRYVAVGGVGFGIFIGYVSGWGYSKQFFSGYDLVVDK